MCEMDGEDYLLDGEVLVEQEDFQESVLEEERNAMLPAKTGKWDVIAVFGIGDEVVLEQCVDLLIGKILIKDHYSKTYKGASLVIRRRQREWFCKEPKRLVRTEKEHKDALVSAWDETFPESKSKDIDDPIPF